VALLEWNSHYSIGVQEMDHQHQTLFNILNELHAAMSKGTAQNVAGDLLQKLIDYTREHFSAEEALMKAVSYPGFAGHLLKHKELLKQAEDMAARHSDGDHSVSIQLMPFLRQWLTTHIQQEDRRYSAYVIKHGESKAAGKSSSATTTASRI
jgi:hemerythrin